MHIYALLHAFFYTLIRHYFLYSYAHLEKIYSNSYTAGSSSSLEGGKAKKHGNPLGWGWHARSLIRLEVTRG